MSHIPRMPRKYRSVLDETGYSLRAVGHQASQVRQAINQLDQRSESIRLVGTLIRDIEATVLRVALDLSQIKFSETCDGCPAAPAVTTQQVAILTTIGELERLKQLLHVGLGGGEVEQ